MRISRLVGASTLVIMASLAAGAAAHAQGRAETCTAMAAATLPGYDLKVASAEHVTDENGAHCLVKGSFEHRKGADGKDYAVGFAVALPDNWSGRFLVQGGGGLNGVVRPPVGPTAAGSKTALSRGFAVISHDSGHQGEAWDASFKLDQIASLNFAGWAVEKTTLVGKQLVASYYERPADKSYFAGCSTGGREAMLSAQRYPLMFDGVIAGAPAIRTNRSNMSLASKAVSVNQISPVGADGTPDRSAAFSAGDRQLILDGMLNACDELDGAKDGIIFNGAACSFDPSVLMCNGEKGDACLSPEQVKVVKNIFAPALDASGREAYPSFPFDTAVMSETDAQPGLMRFDDKRNRQFRNHAMEYDIDAAVQAVDVDDPHQRLTNVDQWSDLSSFAHNGGKLLFFHGNSDPWFSANDTIQNFDRMSAETGKRHADPFSKLYLVPGLAHCRGGDTGLETFDLLTALVDWVENGKVPESVIATGSTADRSRPLCPYPSYAHYKGDGNIEDAANYECRN